ncbi:MAG: hypothetical protein GY696_20005 [Gammaproteobacteria bacterium]|nr:hypothetical protein [Gammaproteobacteria bacterium]
MDNGPLNITLEILDGFGKPVTRKPQEQPQPPTPRQRQQLRRRPIPQRRGPNLPQLRPAAPVMQLGRPTIRPPPTELQMDDRMPSPIAASSPVSTFLDRDLIAERQRFIRAEMEAAARLGPTGTGAWPPNARQSRGAQMIRDQLGTIGRAIWPYLENLSQQELSQSDSLDSLESFRTLNSAGSSRKIDETQTGAPNFTLPTHDEKLEALARQVPCIDRNSYLEFFLIFIPI